MSKTKYVVTKWLNGEWAVVRRDSPNKNVVHVVHIADTKADARQWLRDHTSDLRDHASDLAAFHDPRSY